MHKTHNYEYEGKLENKNHEHFVITLFKVTKQPKKKINENIIVFDKCFFQIF